MRRQAHPRTRIPLAAAASHTGLNRSMLSSTVHPMFWRLKDWEAAPKMATSLAPAAAALSKP